MLMLAILEGFAGYSLVDDLLSGMGLAIAYSVALSIPFIGAQLGYLVWGGPFPGSSTFLPRLEIVHVLLIPAALAVLITRPPGDDHAPAPLAVPRAGPARAQRRRHADVARLRAALDRAAARRGRRCCSCSAGWSRSTRSGSGGPYHPYLSENGAQPDWYIGWLIGALRLMPNFEPAIGGAHADPQPVLGRRRCSRWSCSA